MPKDREQVLSLKKYDLKHSLHSYQTNLDVLLWISAPLPAYLAGEICLNGFEFPPPSQTSCPFCQSPGNLKMILFLLKLLRNRIKFYWNDLFRAERWNIGIINHSIQELTLTHHDIRTEKILWMRERGSRHYFADPGRVYGGEQGAYSYGRLFI